MTTLLQMWAGTAFLMHYADMRLTAFKVQDDTKSLHYDIIMQIKYFSRELL